MAPTGELPEVIAVEARADYTLLLTFKGGERRVFDVSYLLGTGVFNALRDPATFARAYICEAGTVAWPGEIDIAPETLYDRSVPAVRRGKALKY